MCRSEGRRRSGRSLTVAAKLVLLATGANARVLAAFGVLQEKRPTAYGIRGYFRVPELGDEREMIIMYDRSSSHFYIWFFPVGGGVFNVGRGILPMVAVGSRKTRAPLP